MEIQKIFTDLYDDERIYSVLMDEDELYLFSEIQKEFASVRKTKKLLKTAARQLHNPNLTGKEAIKIQNKTMQGLNDAVKPLPSNPANWTKGQIRGGRKIGKVLDKTDSVSTIKSNEVRDALTKNWDNIEGRVGKWYTPKMKNL